MRRHLYGNIRRLGPRLFSEFRHYFVSRDPFLFRDRTQADCRLPHQNTSAPPHLGFSLRSSQIIQSFPVDLYELLYGNVFKIAL